MTPRLLIGTIALVSFVGTFALIGGRASPPQAQARSVVPIAAGAVTPPAPLPAAAAQQADPEPVDAPPDEAAQPPPAAQFADAKEFLAAQDRAAAHSSRSR